MAFFCQTKRKHPQKAFSCLHKNNEPIHNLNYFFKMLFSRVSGCFSYALHQVSTQSIWNLILWINYIAGQYCLLWPDDHIDLYQSLQDINWVFHLFIFVGMRVNDPVKRSVRNSCKLRKIYLCFKLSLSSEI